MQQNVSSDINTIKMILHDKESKVQIYPYLLLLLNVLS